MAVKKKRIGFLSYWGWGRGQSYVTLAFAKMLKDDYDVYIMKQGTNEISDEFKKVKVKVTEVPNYFVDPEVFKSWIVENKLDAVVFNEYDQWQFDKNDLIQLTKDCGAKAYGYLVMERFIPAQALRYDRVLVPTKSFVKYMRYNRVRNFTYVPFSLDLEDFPKEPLKNDEKFVFFHPAGYGGVKERKNTRKVLEAFKLLDRDDVKLIVSTQQTLDHLRDVFDVAENIEVIEKDLSHDELIKLYYRAHATILPSKWETIGIPILESLAAGRPVITTNAPPMNEFVAVGRNGFLCHADMNAVDGIEVFSADTSALEIKNAMENIMHPELLTLLGGNARHIIEKDYNIEINKKYFIDFLKKDLGEKK